MKQTIEEKLKWKPGTRVVYTGPFGSVELETEAVPTHGEGGRAYVAALAGPLRAGFSVKDLELAPSYEYSVRWEIRNLDKDGVDHILYKFEFENAAKEFLRDLKKRVGFWTLTYRLVKIKTRKVAK